MASSVLKLSRWKYLPSHVHVLWVKQIFVPHGRVKQVHEHNMTEPRYRDPRRELIGFISLQAWCMYEKVRCNCYHVATLTASFMCASIYIIKERWSTAAAHDYDRAVQILITQHYSLQPIKEWWYNFTWYLIHEDVPYCSIVSPPLGARAYPSDTIA